MLTMAVGMVALPTTASQAAVVIDDEGDDVEIVGSGFIALTTVFQGFGTRFILDGFTVAGTSRPSDDLNIDAEDAGFFLDLIAILNVKRCEIDVDGSAGTDVVIKIASDNLDDVEDVENVISFP
ncbi:hypothetical protein [Pseudobythopirellula maris]|nr:hypothetical protein [Pseudobythopirellula maris]